MLNENIKIDMLKNNISQVDIANYLGITRSRVCTILSNELSEKNKERILDAISKLKEKGNETDYSEDWDDIITYFFQNMATPYWLLVIRMLQKQKQIEEMIFNGSRFLDQQTFDVLTSCYVNDYRKITDRRRTHE